MLIGSMLVDAGHSDDYRFVMGMGVRMITRMGLASLGVIEEIDSGPVLLGEERIAALKPIERA